MALDGCTRRESMLFVFAHRGMPVSKHEVRNNDGIITWLLGMSAPAAFAKIGITANLAEGGLLFKK